MNLQFKRHSTGLRIVSLNGKAIGTLEYTFGKWLLQTSLNRRRPEYRRYFKSVSLAKQFCKADPKFYIGYGA